MIISCWRGFEIDSSEGYYVFDKEMEHAEEGWDFMLRLLSSPLLWGKIAFEMSAVEGEAEKVNAHVQAVLERGAPKESEFFSEYCQFRYVAEKSTFLGLVKTLRPAITSIGVNFCLAPFHEVPVEELAKLKTWFFKQFSDRKQANRRWKDYARVRPGDFMLRGHSEMTDEWAENYAFEACFQLYLTAPFSYVMSMSAGDPSLILYLLATLSPRHDLQFVGDHLSLNFQPDLLDLPLRAEREDEESPD